MLDKFLLRVVSARSMRDPNFNTEHGTENYIFTVRAKDLPSGIGFDPSARTPKIQRRVYQKVINSLLQKDDSELGTFHLKNKGITIIANSVRSLGSKSYEVELRTGQQGIIDGGHTYEIITQYKNDQNLSDHQYVTVEVRVGIPDAWIPGIADGLNTIVQAQNMSLDNLANRCAWIKSELKGEPYYKRIAWSENDEHDYDARDIISMLLCFNIELYPNSAEEHPLEAYSRKAAALQEFENNPESFIRMRAILKDILKFHDIVSQEGRDHYVENQRYRLYREIRKEDLTFVEERDTQPYQFMFAQTSGRYRLAAGALYPMMAAFRWYVQEDPLSKDMRWDGGFTHVLDTWRSIGSSLMSATINTRHELGRNPVLVGRSKNHWANLHRMVGFKKLRDDMSETSPEAEDTEQDF